MMIENCPFCTLEEVILENEYCYAKYDKFPVSPGHVLIISKRHVSSWFDLCLEEQSAALNLLSEAKKLIDETFHPDAYNIGVNCGEVAGQTIMHVHMHLIPRYEGDVTNPRGGVRAVIACKKEYPNPIL